MCLTFLALIIKLLWIAATVVPCWLAKFPEKSRICSSHLCQTTFLNKFHIHRIFKSSSKFNSHQDNAPHLVFNFSWAWTLKRWRTLKQTQDLVTGVSADLPPASSTPWPLWPCPGLREAPPILGDMVHCRFLQIWKQQFGTNHSDSVAEVSEYFGIQIYSNSSDRIYS